MSDKNEVLERLGNAQIAAGEAVAELSDRMDNETDPVEREAIRKKLKVARRLEKAATAALGKEIFNPADSAAATLEDATDRLEKRIEKFKAEEASLNDLAAALTGLESAIRLILLVV